MPRCPKSVLPVPCAKNRIRETSNFYAAQGGLVVYSGRKGDPGGGSSKVAKQPPQGVRFLGSLYEPAVTAIQEQGLCR